MKPEFNYNGLEIETFDEIYQRLAASLRQIYGNDINLELDSPDGQRVAIIAQLVLDLETFALQLYNQMDADFAIGDWLNKLIKFAGIFRRPATRSQVDVTVTTDRPLTLPAGFTISDDLGQLWIITNSVDLVIGANTVTFVAQEFGEFSAASGTVTTLETIILGVLSVTNPAPSLDGRDEETDEELKIRRDSSVENPAYSTVGSLVAKLANLANVTDVVVYENDQDTTDIDKDIPPHTIWAVIEGGSVADIVETLVKQRTSGCGTKGDESGIFNEVVTRPDGSTFNIVHEMEFDRPQSVDLYIRFTATRLETLSPIDLDLMKTLIGQRRFRIGENLKASSLYSIIYRAGSNFVLSDLEISDDDTVWTDENLISAWDGKFTVDPANITITEVV
jgi:uncharacterized phage protein gp47/JayE